MCQKRDNSIDKAKNHGKHCSALETVFLFFFKYNFDYNLIKTNYIASFFVLLFLFRQLGVKSDLFQLVDELATSMHLEHDVTAANELALEEYLWYGRPIGEFLDAISQTLVGQHIVGVECHAVHLQYVTHCLTKAAKWLLSSSLKESSFFLILLKLGFKSFMRNLFFQKFLFLFRIRSYCFRKNFTVLIAHHLVARFIQITKKKIQVFW